MIRDINQIRTILEKYNISQREIADAMKIGQSSIHNYFCGKRKLTHKMFYKIINGLWAICNQRIKDSCEFKNDLNQMKIKKEKL